MWGGGDKRTWEQHYWQEYERGRGWGGKQTWEQHQWMGQVEVGGQTDMGTALLAGVWEGQGVWGQTDMGTAPADGTGEGGGTNGHGNSTSKWDGWRWGGQTDMGTAPADRTCKGGHKQTWKQHQQTGTALLAGVWEGQVVGQVWKQTQGN